MTCLTKISFVSWEPEGRYCRSKMFRWEPQGRYCHWFCTAIAPFWLPTEHLWAAITPFWLSTDDFFVTTEQNRVFFFVAEMQIISYSFVNLNHLQINSQYFKIYWCWKSDCNFFGGTICIIMSYGYHICLNDFRWFKQEFQCFLQVAFFLHLLFDYHFPFARKAQWNQWPLPLLQSSLMPILVLNTYLEFSVQNSF